MDSCNQAVTNKIEVRSSSISGKGTFAIAKISKGEYITTLTGEPIPAREHKQICVHLGLSEDDPLQISEETYLILVPASKQINHSCAPNAGLRNVSDLYAVRDILPGEEIAYDYSTTVGMEDTWSMNCCCGAELCRGVIANVTTLPVNVINSYIELDAFPIFIQQQLKRIAETESV